MARTASTMQALGTQAPAFRLPDPVTGEMVSLEDFHGSPAVLVMFLCNHCPFVKHIRAQLAELVREAQRRGVAAFGINSNDAATHPADAPEKMVEEVREHGYSFPYLYDESQQVAQAYRAACTPDFFLYDAELRLVYRGQFDASRPGNDVAVTGEDLRRALEAVLSNGRVDPEQRPSLGCNIKWKPGNEPEYFA